MKSERLLLVVGLLTLLVVSACAQIPATEGTAGGADVKMPDDYLTLLDDLRSTGAVVADGGEMGQSLFDVAAQVVKVDGETVQIFIFESEDARKAAQNTISENASKQDPGFGDRPYFWSRGRMLALYDGENPKVLSSMNLTLGKPVVEPGTKIVPPDLGKRESG